MKIVMLCEFYNETLEFQENLLTKYYSKHGHSVVVIASTFDSVFDYYAGKHNKHAPKRTYFDGSAKVIKLPFKFNILNRLRRLTDIAGILNEESPDLIYVHDIMLNFPEVIAYKKRHPKCRVIMDYHADYSNAGKNWLSLRILHGVIRKWYLDRARKHLSRIFPIVPSSVKFLHEIYKVPLSEMELLPLGVDIDQGRQVKKTHDRDKLRNQMGVESSDFVLFTGGKLAPRKQTELLFRAVQILGRKDVHVFVVGDFPEENPEYRDSVLKEAAAIPNIHFVGWLNSTEVYNYLHASDIAVFPASQSIMWQQAIGMELPLIVGDTGKQDPSYLNRNGNMIILSKDQITAEHIADAVRCLLDSPQLRARMSAAASKVTVELLDWNAQIEKTLQFNKID